MYRFLILVLIFISQQKAHAQINEFGIFAGGSNYIGDIGPTQYIAPNDLALGLIYKWNRSTRHAYRFSFTYGKLQSNDLDSKVPARIERGYNFNNTIQEFSGGIEFNFFDFNLHNANPQITPYIFSGLNYVRYNELFVINDTTLEDEKKGTLSIPMVLGVKAKLWRDFILGIEVGARYSFTDNLDGSNPKKQDLNIYKFGNINSNDWYVFTGITLTYTFGENPCYCPE
jgi:hypothetical protein